MVYINTCKLKTIAVVEKLERYWHAHVPIENRYKIKSLYSVVNICK